MANPFRKEILENDSLNNQDSTTKKVFSIRKQIENREDVEKIMIKESETITDEEMADFFIKVLGEETLKIIREKNYIALRNADIHDTNERWIKSFFEDYFDEERQNIIKQNIYKYFLAPILKYEKSNDFLTKELNRYHQLLKKESKTVEIKLLIDEVIGDNDDYEEVELLLKKSLKKTTDDNSKFIISFLFSLQKIILLKDFKFDSQEEKRDKYLFFTKSLLTSISGSFITLRKEILREVARVISKEFDDISFVSSEDYTFVDPKIHNVPENGGERVLEAKSFAIINKESKNTIIYADIVAQ